LELRIGLEADFDGVEGVALAGVSDCVSPQSSEVCRDSCGDDFLAVILVDASRRELRRELHRHESSEVPDIATMMVKFIIASLE
jgi:hypothetical protein